ncbi:hypothetical protein DAPPUDRAFT_109870 [Daphnia pulex]|uniref:Uncharacterized protein n=1 Tax=Daphnia pulex TaxID=6669 RepID=E9H4G7_DAPPU|nr:hypothetical protein DAPPUDRAFT_109870 [Daphnia pulex]|eukprot:EFX73401.1 hypothetical protein DAPPUDRAFT_109870 [Daphnia pulex]
MEHAQTCPTPDVVAVMTQQPASPPDVSIAVMTKSSNRATEKRILKESNFTLDQSSPDLTGAQENNIGMKQIVPETMNSYTDANKSILFLLGDDTENLKHWIGISKDGGSNPRAIKTNSDVIQTLLLTLGDNYDNVLKTIYSNSGYNLSQLQGSVVRATDSRFSGPVFKLHPRQQPVN